MSQGKLVIFSAPSGAGKTTLVHHLLSIPELRLQFSVSATSRAKRPNEEEGRDYYFLTADEFRERIGRGDFLEWEEVYPGQYYGTLRQEVERIRAQGRNVIFDVDVVGGLNIKKQFGDEALAVFVQPPSIEVLEQRLRHRSTESEESIRARVAKAKQELTYADRFDAIIVNDDLEQAKQRAEQLVRAFLK